MEDQDLLRLTDKHGNPIFCYKCKCSTLSGAPIARCDYCTLSWHLDCLSPPLPTVKTVGTKWKCPNHADHVFRVARRPKNAVIVDTNLRRGFKNDGNIDILDSSDEEQLEINTRDIPKSNARNGLTTTKSSPAPTQNYKQFEQKPDDVSISSQAVRLAFIQPVRSTAEVPYRKTSNSQVLLALDELATKSQDVREGVRNLCYFQFDGTPDEIAARTRTNVELLLESALTLKSPPLQGQTGPKRVKLSLSSKNYTQNMKISIANESKARRSPSHAASNGTSGEIHSNEKVYLSAIKKILKLKGKDALMEFLLQKKDVEK